ncbi:MAG: UDP-2,3-diacylglucosamine diphosphatase [Bacteroidia bacterium]
MNNAKSIFFASDFHLGTPTKSKSENREKLILEWFEQIRDRASHIYLVGDIFDFWHDYKHVVPKGFVRFQAKIKELVDSGIEIHFFTGNHDLWMFGYFEEELGVKLHKKPIQISHQNKKLYVGHGDGLGPGDHGYKFIKKIFTNKICQFLFRWFHPDLGVPLATYLSRSSRESESEEELMYLGEEKEWLVIYSKEILKNKHYDYFVFGHRHVPIKLQLNNSVYINLGDWISNFTFGELTNGVFELKKYQKGGIATSLDFVV